MLCVASCRPSAVHVLSWFVDVVVTCILIIVVFASLSRQEMSGLKDI